MPYRQASPNTKLLGIDTDVGHSSPCIRNGKRQQTSRSRSPSPYGFLRSNSIDRQRITQEQRQAEVDQEVAAALNSSVQLREYHYAQLEQRTRSSPAARVVSPSVPIPNSAGHYSSQPFGAVQGCYIDHSLRYTVANPTPRNFHHNQNSGSDHGSSIDHYDTISNFPSSHFDNSPTSCISQSAPATYRMNPSQNNNTYEIYDSRVQSNSFRERRSEVPTQTMGMNPDFLPHVSSNEWGFYQGFPQEVYPCYSYSTSPISDLQRTDRSSPNQSTLPHDTSVNNFTWDTAAKIPSHNLGVAAENTVSFLEKSILQDIPSMLPFLKINDFYLSTKEVDHDILEKSLFVNKTTTAGPNINNAGGSESAGDAEPRPSVHEEPNEEMEKNWSLFDLMKWLKQI